MDGAARERPTAGRLGLALLAATLLGACSEGGPPLEGDLRERVIEQAFTVDARTGGAGSGLVLPASPRLAPVEAGGERRPAVVLPPGAWRWEGRVPRRARLAGAAQLVPLEGAPAAPVGVRVTAIRDLERVVLVDARGTGDWLAFEADLGRFAGRRLTLEVEAQAPAGRDVAWAPVRIDAGGESARPDLVVLLADTLRADRMGLYGGPSANTPQITAELARHGVVVERAYAQAPWTLPSVASLLTSRPPERFLGEDPGGYRMPEAPALAERLQALGYHTAGFFANPTLHRGNGFARGFETFFTPEDPLRWADDLDAAHVTRRVEAWLAAYRGRPFFLYVHLVDPHDPYANPDMPHGRSPFGGDYRGPIAGDHVHGLYLGRVELEDPERDVAQVRALYDGEIAYLDRHVGQLVRTLDRVSDDFLVALTSDHGEELWDHGGWKHGRTLYEEQLRVPLILRWDGRLPAGRRVPGPALLLDLAPTLAAAAGLAAPLEWAGRDLLPSLAGERPFPRQARFAQHFGGGPPRAAVTLDGWKLHLYDRQARFAPPNDHDRLLAEQDHERLPRLALFDLAADPAERHDLSAAEPERVRRLGDLAHRHLASSLPGLRLLLAGAATGQRVRGSLRLDIAPEAVESYFLASGDSYSVDGATIRFDLGGEALAKGLRVLGSFERVEAVEVAGAAVIDGEGRPLPAGGAALATLRAAAPPAAAGGALVLWLPEQAAVERPPESSDPETVERLRALGYAG